MGAYLLLMSGGEELLLKLMSNSSESVIYADSMLAEHKLHPRHDDPLHDFRLRCLVLARSRSINHDIGKRHDRPAESKPLTPTLLDYKLSI
jgi:hypothetical protein